MVMSRSAVGAAGSSGFNPVRDLGNISGLTSANIDAIYSVAPADGTLAVGYSGSAASPVLLARRNGKWNVTAALTVIS